MTRDGTGRARAKRGIARTVTAIGIGSTVLLGSFILSIFRFLNERIRDYNKDIYD